MKTAAEHRYILGPVSRARATDHLLRPVSQLSWTHRSRITSCLIMCTDSQITYYILSHNVHWLVDHLLRPVSQSKHHLFCPVSQCAGTHISCITSHFTDYANHSLSPVSYYARTHRSLITSCFTKCTDHLLHPVSQRTDAQVTYCILFHKVYRSLITFCALTHRSLITCFKRARTTYYVLSHNVHRLTDNLLRIFS